MQEMWGAPYGERPLMLPHEVLATVESLRQELRHAQETLAQALQRSVRADREYRLAKAKAYLRSDGKTVPEREAQVELEVDESRLEAKMAEGQVEAGKQRLLNLRQELSAVTSLVYLSRTEAELAR